MYSPKEIVNEEINNFIFEILDTLISTEYDILKDNKYAGFYFDIYRFKSNSGNYYDVDFYKSEINPNEYDNISKYFSNVNKLKIIDIGFTSTNYDRTEPINLENPENDPYVKRTNKNEQYEVLGKVGYLIQEYINNNPDINVYAVGKNSNSLNLAAYLQMYKNIFANKFILIEDRSENYNGDDAYYFIKNNLI
jgi:hypothetical protein